VNDERIERRLERLEDDMTDLERIVTDAVATWRGLALKQIGAVVVAALGLAGTFVATRPGPPAATRSAYDISLDECRPLTGVESRECWARKESPRAAAPGASR
jgi:anti-sigma-K factor RskA